MVTDWEADSSEKNPFQESSTGESFLLVNVVILTRISVNSSMAQVRQELAQEEMDTISYGQARTHEVSPFNFLLIGLDLEEQQCAFTYYFYLRTLINLIRRALKVLATGKKTPLEAAEIHEKRNTLAHRLDAWFQVQYHYMPGIAELRASNPELRSLPEMSPLYMPSGAPFRQDENDLARKEARLRLAQADDALAKLRRLLRITSGLRHYNWKQVGPSQRSRTRAHAIIERFQAKIHLTTERYRAARAALVRLDPFGSWILRLKELKSDDIKGPSRDDEGPGDGRHELSWIWLASAAGESDDEFDGSTQSPPSVFKSNCHSSSSSSN